MIKHKPLLLSLVTLLLLAGGVAALEVTNTTHLFHRASSPVTKAREEAINYSPATDEEQADSDSHKVDSSNSQNQNTNGSSTTTKKQVEVNITRWGKDKDNSNLNVNGYVDGIVEDGGICTLTLKNGSSVVSQSRKGVSNATNTTCGETSVPLSKLHSGTWQATLSYSSSTSTGNSAASEIVVN